MKRAAKLIIILENNWQACLISCQFSFVVIYVADRIKYFASLQLKEEREVESRGESVLAEIFVTQRFFFVSRFFHVFVWRFKAFNGSMASQNFLIFNHSEPANIFQETVGPQNFSYCGLYGTTFSFALLFSHTVWHKTWPSNTNDTGQDVTEIVK